MRDEPRDVLAAAPRGACEHEGRQGDAAEDPRVVDAGARGHEPLEDGRRPSRDHRVLEGEETFLAGAREPGPAEEVRLAGVGPGPKEEVDDCEHVLGRRPTERVDEQGIAGRGAEVEHDGRRRLQLGGQQLDVPARTGGMQGVELGRRVHTRCGARAGSSAATEAREVGWNADHFAPFSLPRCVPRGAARVSRTPVMWKASYLLRSWTRLGRGRVLQHGRGVGAAVVRSERPELVQEVRSGARRTGPRLGVRASCVTVVCGDRAASVGTLGAPAHRARHPTATATVDLEPVPAPRTPRVDRKYQHLLDKTTPFVLGRWIFFAVVVALFSLRIYLVNGYFLVTYGLGIHLLNLLAAFLSPIEDSDTGRPVLPEHVSAEYRPFSRKVSEFKFWHESVRVTCIAFVLTFIPLFNVPAFWPVLVLYFVVLFVFTCQKRIQHMIKYRYLPFDFGGKKKPDVAPPAAPAAPFAGTVGGGASGMPGVTPLGLRTGMGVGGARAW